MTIIKFDEVEVGFELPKLTHTYKRQDLVDYANASGDQNRIHLDEEFAKSVGLPDVIAHGMLTMALAGNVVTKWLKDINAIKSFSVKFGDELSFISTIEDIKTKVGNDFITIRSDVKDSNNKDVATLRATLIARGTG